MTPYICLILYLLVLPLFIQSRKIKKREAMRLLAALFPIYLLMALKAPSVGRDISGYARMYESFFYASWSNYDLYWTEWGYETLEMFFTHILNFNFTQFAATLYAFICVSYYKFWKRYSKDGCLSCLVYVCFGFICFDLSGLRNALALAIFLLAVPYAEKRGFWNGVKYFAILWLATQIHNSAYAGIFYFLMIRYSFPKIAYALAPIVVLASQSVLAPLVMEVSSKNISGSAFGGNLIFYVVVLLLPLLLWSLWKKVSQNGEASPSATRILSWFQEMAMPMRTMYTGTLFLMFSGGGSFSRVANFGLFFISVLIPNALYPLNRKSRTLLRTLVTIFLLVYFWFYKLRTNELDILPYRFFWE